jgi:hypothetical protein
VKAKVDAEKYRADTDRESEKARLVRSVFKMKLANLDLPTISSFSGLNIEESEQILN